MSTSPPKLRTNDFHGTAYKLFRNNVLNARKFFATTGPAPEFRLMILAGTLAAQSATKRPSSS